MATPRIIILDTVTTTSAGTGPALGLQGDAMALPFEDGATPATAADRNLHTCPIEVFTYNTATSSTATVLLEQSVGIRAVITAVTKANPASVTATAHGFATGDVVSISGVNGMVELNGNTYTITVTNANVFTLGVDSTAYGTYTSGGVAFGPWTVWQTLTFASVATKKSINSVGTLKTKYFRGRVTAISGATINGYLRFKD